MVFDEISLENFATFRKRCVIELRPKNRERPIILIGGENGCGKTTLLDALQLVLFGPLARCSNRGRLGYKAYLKKCINRNVDPEEGAKIELVFRTQIGGAERTFKICRSWSKTKKKITEKFVVYRIEDGNEKYDQVFSENWNDYVEGIFPTRVAPFFLFDGEKIELLAEFENSGPIIRSAIYSLLGLDYIDRLSTDLLTLERKKHKVLLAKIERELIDKLEEEIKLIQKKIEELVIQEAKYMTLRDRQERKIEENEMRYKLHGGDLYDRQVELEMRYENSKEILHQHEDELRHIAAGASPLLLVKDLLKDIQQKSEREEDAVRAKYIYESLETRDQKLMTFIESFTKDGNILREINNHLLHERNSEYKKAQYVAYLNLDHGSVQKLSYLLSTELPKISKDIPVRIDKIKELCEQVEACERQLSSIPEEETLSEIIKERETLKEHLSRINFSLEFNAEELRKLRYELYTKNIELKRLLVNSAESEREEGNNQRVLAYSRKARHTLDIFRKKVLLSHLHHIEKLILDSFQRLIRKEVLIKRLSINMETFCLHLYDHTNNELTPDRLSAGERQLLATSILWGICRAAGKPLPTIIDTPLGRLDTSHRTNLVTSYFPDVSHQVILLSTNEEIVGKHYRAMEPFISHKYLLTHDGEEKGTRVIEGYFIDTIGKVA